MEKSFKLNSADKIIGGLDRLKQQRNFPKTVTFPFEKSYKDIVCVIKTVEISAECILYDSVESFNYTTDFRDADYWKESCSREDIDNWWIFGQNGQGDLWLFDKSGKVYFYDHDKEEMCVENFIELGIDFAKWIQLADLSKQYEELYCNEETCFDNGLLKSTFANDYKERLKELSFKLLENYPFKI